MTAGKAIAHLQRMIARREERLKVYEGTSDSYLRAEIATLRYALELAEREWTAQQQARAV